jgi:hypothetical protein
VIKRVKREFFDSQKSSNKISGFEETSDARERLLNLFESLSYKEWEIKTDSNYTIKELLAQAVAWEEEFAVCLRDSWQTKEKPWFLKTNKYEEFNKAAIRKYQSYNSKELIERWRFVIKVLDSEIRDIGVGNLRVKQELFNWIFDLDNSYLKYLNKIKKALH